MTPQERIKAALEDLGKVDPKPGCPITDDEMTQYERDCAVFIILNYKLIHALLEAAQGVDFEALGEAVKEAQQKRLLPL